MSNIHWLKTNNIFKKVNGDFSTINELPLGVYNVGLSLEGWYLEKYADEFTFDYKIYGFTYNTNGKYPKFGYPETDGTLTDNAYIKVTSTEYNPGLGSDRNTAALAKYSITKV